jgi:protocatechuate 3,4-dioxygenase beta subunit
MSVRPRLYPAFVAAVFWVPVLSACTADPADEVAGSDLPTATRSTAGPLRTVEPAPPATPGQRCSDTTAAAVADATVTFGPINGVEATTAAGEPLTVVGTVYSEDCRPLAGARLTMWQTDGNGEYGPGHGTDGMRCCFLGGNVVTDADGNFQLITVRPAHYRGESSPPPAHIHLEVQHPDVPPLRTEIVFADDDRLPADSESLGYIVTNPTREGGSWHAVAEIVMSGLPARRERAGQCANSPR